MHKICNYKFSDEEVNTKIRKLYINFSWQSKLECLSFFVSLEREKELNDIKEIEKSIKTRHDIFIHTF